MSYETILVERKVLLTAILELNFMGSTRGLRSLKRRIKDLMNFIP